MGGSEWEEGEVTQWGKMQWGEGSEKGEGGMQDAGCGRGQS